MSKPSFLLHGQQFFPELLLGRQITCKLTYLGPDANSPHEGCLRVGGFQLFLSGVHG